MRESNSQRNRRASFPYFQRFPPWHQGSIRKADRQHPHSDKISHSACRAVKVTRDGKYHISLRRWPLESGAAINASLPAGENVPGSDKAFRATPGESIRTTLRIDGKDPETKPVEKRAVSGKARAHREARMLFIDSTAYRTILKALYLHLFGYDGRRPPLQSIHSRF